MNTAYLILIVTLALTNVLDFFNTRRLYRRVEELESEVKSLREDM